ncbi:hypothetical protein IFR05_008278 [Cadophora sp. M221]|nr:hypothetical protein IFR05_008278 [Cadophora sp. M221]
MYQSVADKIYQLAESRKYAFTYVQEVLENCAKEVRMTYVDLDEDRRLHHSEYMTWGKLFHVTFAFPAVSPWEYELDTSKILLECTETYNLKLSKKNAHLKKKVRAWKGQVETLNDAMVKERVEVGMADSARAKILILEKELRDLSSKNIELLTNKKSLKTKSANKSVTIKKFNAVVEDLMERNKEYVGSISGLDKKIKDIKKMNESLSKEKSALTNFTSISQYTSCTIDRLRADTEELMEKINSLDAEKKNAEFLLKSQENVKDFVLEQNRKGKRKHGVMSVEKNTDFQALEKKNRKLVKKNARLERWLAAANSKPQSPTCDALADIETSDSGSEEDMEEVKLGGNAKRAKIDDTTDASS